MPARTQSPRQTPLTDVSTGSGDSQEHTQVIVCYAQIKERACVPPDLYASSVVIFGGLNITFLKLQSPHFETTEGLDLGGISGRRLRRGGCCPS
jgi:hypothetical protein